ncbi:uncharacterized protein LOC132740189 [Ruditapes philippinarum]|uniref:uncharacterized protein LOC132740189 n=1 Tax=Ruditapes philippinarum TaxID=129788 RepID=UPI00295B1EAA|nr:uncharacterized protein LOC132740189 [Ruditapes philippinarum]
MVRLEEDECGRVKLQAVNGTLEETFYSQDIKQYLWIEFCFNKVDGDLCQGGRFIDLFVKGSRLIDREEGRVADLTSLPWELISTDLKNIFGAEFSDPATRYVFIGKDCEV